MGKKRAKKTSRPLSAEDLEVFNRQLVTAARSGAPLVPALEALSRDLRRGRLKDAVDSLAAELQTGSSLAEALERHRAYFPPLYTAMGEAAASGNLEGVMAMVSHLVTSAAGLRRKVVTAAAYPIVVFVAAAGLMAFLSFMFVPGILALVREFGAGWNGRHPQTWPILMITGFGMAVALLIVGALLILLLIRLLPGGREVVSRLLAKLPLYGAVVRSQRAFVFCRTFAVLLRAGVPMREAIRVVREVSPDAAAKDVLDRVAEGLHAGGTLGEAMTEATARAADAGFPAELVWTVSVAESRGDLPEGLYEASEYYAEDAERRGLFLMQALPTVLVVFVGIFVAATALPIFGAFAQMFQMMTNLGSMG